MYQSEPRAQPTDQPPPPDTACRDVAPLTPRQIYALARAVLRHLLWGLPHAAQELSRWRRRAMAAADPALRCHALTALREKRPQSEGAALFTILPIRRHKPLLSLLIAYQIIWDYLDSVHEQQPDLDNGIQLHRALSDVYQTDTPLSAYYHLHADNDDSGYLNALVLQCRYATTRLARFSTVRIRLLHEAHRCSHALSINHQTDPDRREREMRAWARPSTASDHAISWFEQTAAAAAALAMFALLAQAAGHASPSPAELNAIRSAYNPWACCAATMLDSYADRDEDQRHHQHIYIDYYPSPEQMTEKTGRLIRECLARTRPLQHGHTHAVLLASMIAMYLTRQSSRAPQRRQTTKQLARLSGTLTRTLIPALRIWRAAYRLRSA